MHTTHGQQSGMSPSQTQNMNINSSPPSLRATTKVRTNWESLQEWVNFKLARWISTEMNSLRIRWKESPRPTHKHTHTRRRCGLIYTKGLQVLLKCQRFDLTAPLETKVVLQWLQKTQKDVLPDKKTQRMLLAGRNGKPTACTLA